MNLPNSTKPSAQSGFTLIELIIVIVILGTLAVTAAPKFLDLNGDAKIAVLESVGGAMLSASKLVYAKSAIRGQNSLQLSNIDIDGDGSSDIETRYGYPSGSRNSGISAAMSSNFEKDWIWSTDYRRTKLYLTFASLTHTSGAYVNQVPIVATNCYLIYYRAENLGETPSIEYTTSGC